ncbi:MAG: hypothetical protein GEV03_07025 [Streptosporangiales bacterium]|nr:hypothetical protein [Streptosporangiales bacterium]
MTDSCTCGCREVYPSRLASMSGWAPSSVPLPITPLEFDMQACSFARGFGRALTDLLGRPVSVAVRNRCGALDILLTRGTGHRPEARDHHYPGDFDELWRSRIGPATADNLRFFAAADATAVPDAMADLLRDVVDRMTKVTYDHHMLVLPARMALAEFAEFARRLEITASVLDGLGMLAGEQNATTRMAVRLWQVRHERRLPALPQEGDGYGLAHPRWLEEDAVPRALAALYRRVEPTREPRRLLAHSAERRRRLESRANARLRRLPSSAQERFGTLLARAKSAAQVTEGHAPLMHAQVTYALRGLVLRLGARLVGLGLLNAADDAFQLRIGDLGRASGSDYRQTVEHRRRHTHLPAPETKPPSDPPSDFLGDSPAAGLMRRVFGEPPQRADRQALTGHPGAPGRSRGRIRRVLLQADLARVEPGDVVFAGDSSAAWSFAAPAAAALLADTGSPYGHLAALARDYSLPCVVGLGAASWLHDGELVEVDGDAGTVAPVRDIP